MDTIDAADIREVVEHSLTDFADEHDVDGIVREIIDTYGLVDLETIPHDAYWAIVQRHAR